MCALRLLIALLLLAGCHSAPPRAPAWLAEPGMVYCYHTLADPDCARQPDAGSAQRLIAAAPDIFFRPAGAAPEE
jgi:hypothetical protein